MLLPRLQLFELEDLEWVSACDSRPCVGLFRIFGSTLRSAQTCAALAAEGMFGQTGTLNVVDLCSGRGELVLALYEALASEGINVAFTLTDKFPNLRAFRYISLNIRSIFTTSPVPSTPQKYLPSWLDCVTY
jgi:hypothetical protein